MVVSAAINTCSIKILIKEGLFKENPRNIILERLSFGMSPPQFYFFTCRHKYHQSFASQHEAEAGELGLRKWKHIYYCILFFQMILFVAEESSQDML